MLEKICHYIERLTRTTTIDELRQSLTEAVHGLGFSTYSIRVNKTRTAQFMESSTLTNWTMADLAPHANDDWAPRDSLLKCAATCDTPFTWRAHDLFETRHRDYAKCLTDRGIVGGVTIPLSHAPEKLGVMTLLTTTEKVLNRDTLLASRIIALVAMSRTSALPCNAPKATPSPSELEALSGHQMKILKLVAQGKTNREIGIILGSSTRTIDYHMREILNKLTVTSRAQAAAVLASSQS